MTRPERRACERFSIPKAKVDWRSQGDRGATECPLGDLSRGGARFQTPGPPDRGAAIDVTLHIPDEAGPLHLRGTVVWRMVSSGQLHNVAIAFEPYGSGNEAGALERLEALEARFLRRSG
jgi:hypothetical protein